MFRNVLVGVGDADGGRDAIALAKMLLAAMGELTLAHVYRDGSPGPWRMADVQAQEERERDREMLERAGAEAGVQARIRWRGAPSIGRGLHEIAETIDADLLVVGSSRRGLLGRAALGDDTRAALNGAPCAIAIAPAGYGSEPPVLVREIGVGFDGSPESEHALGVARGLATEMGAMLSAFQAISIPTYLAHGHGAPGSTPLRQLVDDARAAIASHEGVEPHAAYGDPVEELTLYSASLDLLVVGSRSYGPVGRLIHGSTAQHLARSARSPLLVLTRSTRTASIPVQSDRGLNAVPTG
ncbi:MAG TPA: universal stress protein [Solirubrobacteraceae bacterium]|nr:universal stress protein [Solirubrobacteraceae bacterium]